MDELQNPTRLAGNNTQSERNSSVPRVLSPVFFSVLFCCCGMRLATGQRCTDVCSAQGHLPLSLRDISFLSVKAAML
jgi:hypothetical protein